MGTALPSIVADGVHELPVAVVAKGNYLNDDHGLEVRMREASVHANRPNQGQRGSPRHEWCLRLRGQFYDSKRPLLAVRSQLLSTIVSRDPRVYTFQRLLRVVTPSMDDSDLAAVRPVAGPRSPCRVGGSGRCS